MVPHIIAPSYALVSLTSEPFCSKLPIMLVNERLDIFMPIVPKTPDFCQKNMRSFALQSVLEDLQTELVCQGSGFQRITMLSVQVKECKKFSEPIRELELTVVMISLADWRSQLTLCDQETE